MDDKTQILVENAVRKGLAAEIGTNRYIDVSRIPLICQSIVGIDTRLKSIESNLAWAVRIIVGAVLVALLALVLK